MDSTLRQILTQLFEYSQETDRLRARVAKLEGDRMAMKAEATGEPVEILPKAG